MPSDTDIIALERLPVRGRTDRPAGAGRYDTGSAVCFTAAGWTTFGSGAPCLTPQDIRRAGPGRTPRDSH